MLGSDGLDITFANRGAAGAVFHTRARTAQSTAGMQAKMFTVEAGRQLNASFAASSTAGYDIEVHGPNGFYRHFAAGTTAPGLEVATRRSGASEVLHVIVTNTGAPTEVTITDAYGQARKVTEKLRTGGRVEYVVGERAQGWYDVTVSAGGDAAFMRRLAGHVETGRSSVSDPALGH